MAEITTTEQEYQAELNRQRQHEREMQNYQRKQEHQMSRGARISTKRQTLEINPIESGFMVGFALFVDGIQWVLSILIIGFAVNWIISGVAWVAFFLWLKLKGASMADARGTRIMLASISVFGVEILPLNWLPAWTAFALGLLIMEYGRRFSKLES